MTDKQETIKKMVLARLMRFNAAAQGISLGITVGLVIFIATNWLVLKGGDVVGPHLSLLSQYFIGYSVTFIGSIVGFFYGFLSGFFVGWLSATVYNKIAERREKS